MAFVWEHPHGLEHRPSRRLRDGSSGLRPPFWRLLFAPAATPLASSPWGEVVEWRETAHGIQFFKTASRSGYRLSASRQRTLPPGFQSADAWYEDRTEWAAVAVIFDRIFDKFPAGDARGDSLYHTGKEILKQWRPEEYESWFQTSLDPDEIDQLEIMQFHRQHAARWIATDVFDEPEPQETCLRVRAKQGGDPPYGAGSRRSNAQARWFLVDADEFARGRGRPFLIDLERHVETGAFDISDLQY